MIHHVADRIAAGLAGLAPAQRKVARFFAEHAAQLGFFSAAEIATRLGTSDATVVRTAQNLGYRGLADLKRALLDDAPPPSEPTPNARLGATLRHATTPGDVLDHVLDAHQAALRTARADIEERFPAAVALLAAADRIVLSGTGPSATVARYAAVLLGRVGRPATTITATGVSMADQALQLRRGDALLLLAYTRLHTHAAVLLGLARQRRIPVLLVTDVLTDVDGVDLVLTCPRGLPGEQSSHAVTVLLLEAITVALAAAGRARASTALCELNRLRSQLLGTPADVDAPDT
ncbi:MAG TPA: MurR/RpiR family transcriptional regulator [Pseudonocardiaceae bacterium]|nr:MurR/RpiR family transcriptional regulator [Pseudonocardiaceae bacterium]